MLRARFDSHFPRLPVDGQFTKPVEEPLFLDHGEVALSTLLGVPVVVPHGAGELLVVHPHASVALHEAPGSGEFVGVVHPEHPEGLVYPADYPRVVEFVVEEVADEDVDGRKGNLEGVSSGSTAFTPDGSIKVGLLFT